MRQAYHALKRNARVGSVVIVIVQVERMGHDNSLLFIPGMQKRSPHQRRDGRARFLPGLPSKNRDGPLKALSSPMSGRPIYTSILNSVDGPTDTCETRESQRQVRLT